MEAFHYQVFSDAILPDRAHEVVYAASPIEHSPSVWTDISHAISRHSFADTILPERTHEVAYTASSIEHSPSVRADISHAITRYPLANAILPEWTGDMADTPPPIEDLLPIRSDCHQWLERGGGEAPLGAPAAAVDVAGRERVVSAGDAALRAHDALVALPATLEVGREELVLVPRLEEGVAEAAAGQPPLKQR